MKRYRDKLMTLSKFQQNERLNNKGTLISLDRIDRKKEKFIN